MAKTQKTRRQMMNSNAILGGADDMPRHFLNIVSNEYAILGFWVYALFRGSTVSRLTGRLLKLLVLRVISTALTLFVLHQHHP